ncbi:MAG: hypothetical protein HY372_00005 [Candidatus Andersenbacteria bacterium]|nr:hypothetical protein [Candidatus Andersenbacteria bacterium]
MYHGWLGLQKGLVERGLVDVAELFWLLSAPVAALPEVAGDGEGEGGGAGNGPLELD